MDAHRRAGRAMRAPDPRRPTNPPPRPSRPSTAEAAAAKQDAAHVADAPLFEPAWEDEVDDGFAARLKREVAART